MKARFWRFVAVLLCTNEFGGGRTYQSEERSRANYEEMYRGEQSDIGSSSLCFGGRRQYGLDGGNIPRQFDVNEDGEVNFDDIIIVIES